MDARTISEKSKALVKATQANESPTVIIGILNELKKGVVPSEDILRSTRIGVTVNKSKQHKNPDVARLAGEIVRKWRDEVEKKRETPNGKKPTASPSGTASPAATQDKSKTAPPPSTVPPDQRNWKKDKVKINHTDSSTRDNCIGLIYDGLAYMSTTPPATVMSVAWAIENAAYTSLGPEDKEPYKSKIRSLYQNLKNKANGSLRARVLSNEITPQGFIKMSHEELKSVERREEDKKLETENMRAAQTAQPEKAVSSSLTCSRCGQKKVSYTQAQTRSADEPMTTFCECMNCGKRWKFS